MAYLKLILIIAMASVSLGAIQWNDSLGVRKGIKADTAGIVVKTLTIKQAPAAVRKDTVVYLDSGILKKGSAPNDDTVTAGTGITVNHITGSFQVALYQPPVISVLTNNHAVNYAGQTVTAVTVSWTLTGAAITSQTLTDCTPALGDRSHAFTGLSLTTDKYYTLAITDGTSPSSASTYVLFYIQRFWGTSPDSIATAGDMQAGTNQWVMQSASYRTFGPTTIVCTADFPFYAYPLSWGSVNLTVGSQPVTWLQDTVSVTNAYGDTRNYICYICPNKVVGTISVEAKIPE